MKKIKNTPDTVRLVDIAKEVGVQKSTVSRVLNNTPNQIKVSEKTKQRIIETARRLGYHANAAARSLATNRTGSLGLILSDKTKDGWANAWYSQILNGALNVCTKRGYDMNISLYNLETFKDFVYPPVVARKAVDGIIFCGVVSPKILEKLSEMDMPAVCIGYDYKIASAIPSVYSDYIGGIQQALEELARLGHTRIGIATTANVSQAFVNIRQAVGQFRSGVVGKGCRVRILSPPHAEGGFADAEKVYANWIKTPVADRETAILGTDQVMAAFLKKIESKGMCCPTDVSLFSTVDTTYCVLMHPSISAIQQDVSLMTKIAVDLIISKIERDRQREQAVLNMLPLPCSIIQRGSCAEPRF